MITVRKSDERGHANYGWLDTYHTFSFGGYRDRDHVGFRVLRVINEDRVQPDNGFGSHPHRDMEIISYVVSGELEHKDSMGNGSVIKSGEFQVISAGTGITHSEFNPSSTVPTHFYQIWIVPDKKGHEPAYGQKQLTLSLESNGLELVASGDGSIDGSLTVNQDMKLYFGRLSSGLNSELPLDSERYGWLQVVDGSLSLDGKELNSGDGASIQSIVDPQIVATTDTQFLFFDLP